MFKCAGCTAKDEQIKDLRDQIEWLRIQLGTPLLKKDEAVQPQLEKLWKDDDEEDIEFMLEHDLLPAHAAEAALQHIGALNHEVLIEDI